MQREIDEDPSGKHPDGVDMELNHYEEKRDFEKTPERRKSKPRKERARRPT